MAIEGGPDKRSAAVDAALQSMRRGSVAMLQLFRSRFGGELSAAQGMVLRFLAATPGATPRDVAQFTGLTPGTVTGLLDRLEEQRLLRRQRSTADRRVVHLHLERAGRALADGLQADALRGLFVDWSEGELRDLGRLLDKLSSKASSLAGESRGH